MALSKGYKILKIFEVYHFEQSSLYDPLLADEGGVSLQSMLIPFLRLSKKPRYFCPTLTAKSRNWNIYKRKYIEKEGICLEWYKIQKNPGLRV